MTEREKLIELMGQVTVQCFVNKHCDKCAGYGKGLFCKNYLIADHLLSNGVIVPPIGVGQTLWYIDKYSQTVERDVVKFLTVTNNGVKPILQHHNVRFWEMYQWGKTVFLSKEEAEKALKEKQG